MNEVNYFISQGIKNEFTSPFITHRLGVPKPNSLRQIKPIYFDLQNDAKLEFTSPNLAEVNSNYKFTSANSPIHFRP